MVIRSLKGDKVIRQVGMKAASRPHNKTTSGCEHASRPQTPLVTPANGFLYKPVEYGVTCAAVLPEDADLWF